MTTDTIDAPEQTALATAAAQAIDITTVNLTDLALAKFGPWREQAKTAKTEFAALVLDLQTQSAIDDAISLRNRKIRLPLAEARKTAEALKSKLAAVSKAVGAELPLIEAAWTDAASAITPRIEAAQKVLDDAKEAARLKEEARKDAHREAIAKIRRYLTAAQAPGMTAARIQTGMGMLFDASTGPEFEEFQAEATTAKAETLEAMRVLHDQAAAREAEAARLELQRQENERQAAELAKARAELEAQAAAVRAQAAELDRQRREAERAKAEEDQRKADEAEAEARRAEQAAMTHANGAPMFSATTIKENGDRMMLDDQGKRSIFCDVDEGAEPAADLRAEAAAMIERAQQAPAPVIGHPTAATVVVEVNRAPEPVATRPADTPAAEPAMTHEAFVDLVMQAFQGKFASQPKMPAAWWAKVKAAGEALQTATV